MAIYGAVLYQLKEDDFLGSPALAAARKSFDLLRQSIVKAPIPRHFDQSLDVHVMIFANDRALSSTLIRFHDLRMYPVRFCVQVFEEKDVW